MKAARDVAFGHFDARTVLSRLIDDAFSTEAQPLREPAPVPDEGSQS